MTGAPSPAPCGKTEEHGPHEYLGPLSTGRSQPKRECPGNLPETPVYVIGSPKHSVMGEAITHKEWLPYVRLISSLVALVHPSEEYWRTEWIRETLYLFPASRVKSMTRAELAPLTEGASTKYAWVEEGSALREAAWLAHLRTLDVNTMREAIRRAID